MTCHRLGRMRGALALLAVLPLAFFVLGLPIAAQEPAAPAEESTSQPDREEEREDARSRAADSDSDQADESDEPADSVSEEVTVTATYRETPLMDTPLAITEVGAEEMVLANDLSQ